MDAAEADRVLRICNALARRYRGPDAEDAAREGLLAVLEYERRHPGHDRRRDRYVAWKAMSRHVRRGGERRRVEAAHAAAPRDGARGPATLAADRLDVAAILHLLDDRERRAAWLGLALNWSWPSVAEAIGCSLATVFRLRDSAVAKIRGRHGVEDTAPPRKPHGRRHVSGGPRTAILTLPHHDHDPQERPCLSE